MNNLICKNLNLGKNGLVLASLRQASSQHSKEEIKSTILKDPVRQVFISQSNDVFTNLALEDWLYKNHDFDHKVIFHNTHSSLDLRDLSLQHFVYQRVFCSVRPNTLFLGSDETEPKKITEPKPNLCRYFLAFVYMVSYIDQILLKEKRHIQASLSYVLD